MFNKKNITSSLIGRFLGKSREESTGSFNITNKKESEDEKFIAEITETIKKFKNGSRNSLKLNPMNSYFRHLAHQIAKDNKIFSFSEGSDKDRRLVLSKTNPDKINTNKDRSKTKNKDNVRSRSHSNKQDSRSRTSSNRHTNSNSNDSRNFLVLDSDRGHEIIIDRSGYVGLRTSQKDEDIIDSKVITSGSFTVKGNKITE